MDKDKVVALAAELVVLHKLLRDGQENPEIARAIFWKLEELETQFQPMPNPTPVDN